MYAQAAVKRNIIPRNGAYRRQIIPIFPNFLIGRAFLSAREHPKECLQTREDIDRRMKNAIKEWMEAKQQ